MLVSKIGWIDFSPTDRDKVSTALAMLSEPGTLDELGIGRIRDGYANLLFPGISTIQTRAKYFLTVPRILRDYCLLPVKNKRAYKGIKPYLNKFENDVALRLLEVHGPDEPGIIGRTRVNSGGVDRAPSVIYWNGLRTFEILNTKLSFNDFCRQIDAYDFENSPLHQHDDEEKQSVTYGLIDTPPDDEEWREDNEFSLKLTKSEAEFLREKITCVDDIQQSMLVQLLQKKQIALEALALKTAPGKVSFSDLTEMLSQNYAIHQKTRDIATLANDFSTAMEGPHIAFNIVYAGLVGAKHEEEQYLQQYQNWLEKVRYKALFQPGCTEIWIFGAKIEGNTGSVYAFINQVTELVRMGGDVEKMKKCAAKRAQDNKGQRCVLAQKKQLKTEGKLNWIGMRQLDYRWNTARVILEDIVGVLDA